MSKERSEIYEFGPFRLNVGEHALERTDGESSGSLPEKAFKTLVFLVRRQGRLVTKDELLDAVWDGAVVEENSINKAIHAIRHVLDDGHDHRYIETVRKHGYRFIAPVVERGLLSAEFIRPRIPDFDDTPTVPSPRTRARTLPWILAIAALAILAAALTLAYWRPSPSSPIRTGTSTQRRLTVEGGATRAAISKDGRFAAVAQNAALILFDLEKGSESVLLPASADIRITLISFHPNGTYVYFGTRPGATTQFPFIV